MERELWPLLYRHLREVAKGFSQKYVQFQGWVLVAVLLWAALHDRPLGWACDERHWAGTTLRPPRLPSPSTLSRRLHSVGVGLLLHALEQHLRDQGEPGLVAFLDGKPLTVSGVSKDRAASYGRAAGGKAKGYKLHTVWSTRCLPEAWEVTTLTTAETQVGKELLGRLDHGGYLLADGNYDASGLFDAAFASGYQLLVPLPKGANPGSGKHYQSPQRLRSIELMRGAYGREVYALRGQIERCFGNATSFGGGLAPLPAWVRGSKRVRTWVWAKLLINAQRILYNNDLRHLCKPLCRTGLSDAFTVGLRRPQVCRGTKETIAQVDKLIQAYMTRFTELTKQHDEELVPRDQIVPAENSR